MSMTTGWSGWQAFVLAVGLGLGLVGCGTKASSEETGGAGEGSDGGDGSGNGSGGAELEDPRGAASADPGCEDYDGVPIPGATGYFYGQYVRTDDPTVWEGEEQWILFANDAWRDTGEDDCTITWTTQAIWTEAAGTCSTCEYGLTVEASIDLARTSCPEGLYEGEESFSVVYGVDVNGTTATYSFASSGTFVGTGYAVDGGSNFLTDGSCLYF